MKKHLLTLVAFALMAPAFAAFALDGSGTAADPYKIRTVDDLKAMPNIDPKTYHWFILENDIDLAGISWTPLYTGNYGSVFGRIHFDGNKHVIRNLTSTGSYASLFGQFEGSITNLGLEDVDCNGSGQYDPAGSFAAYAGNTELATFTGCYATGKVNGYYAGGIFGGTKYGAEIKNCYASVETTSSAYAGGLCAAINYLTASEGSVVVKVENSYADGSVESDIAAGGICGSDQTYNHPATSTEILDLKNVIAMNSSVKGTGYAGEFVGFYNASWAYLKLNTENADVFEDMLVNGVQVENGMSYDDCIATICEWDAFALDDEYMPALKWQLENSAGISDIVVDNGADSPAVYYNLQGVQVSDPQNGIYIVRRGNKVAKEVVR